MRETRALEALALRYAANELPPEEAEEFAARLAHDALAQDALAEAVRLSAAALGQAPPTPAAQCRTAIHDRLFGWYPEWLAHRAYRGHPLAWAGLGASVAAAAAWIAVSLAEPEPSDSPERIALVPVARASLAPTALTPPPHEPLAIAPFPHDANDDDDATMAEIWAELSTHDHLEKAHDEELRRRNWLRDIHPQHHTTSRPAAGMTDTRVP